MRLSERLNKLERRSLPPPVVHIITIAARQSREAAFDQYQTKRELESFVPAEGWEELKQEFLNGKNKKPTPFIVFRVNKNIAGITVTNAKP